LTATATPEVRDDIVKQLGLQDSELVITGFSRPNLHFAVTPTGNGQKVSTIVNLLTENKDLGNGIIYVGTRSKADEILEALMDNGVKAVAYHAGLDASSRDWVQGQFMSGAAQVVVATNAFGLGINKRDIRFVIHHDLPGTIEAYYQEAGRAGRDGQDSFCLLFYHQQDRYLREFFIKGDNPDPKIIIEIYDFLQNRVEAEVDPKASVIITYAEIGQSLSDSVPEMAIGTALKILEREGYISRPNEKTSNSYLKAKKPWTEVLAAISPRAKSQREIATALGIKYASELIAGWDFSPEEVAVVLHFKKEALLRAVKKLAEQDLVDYHPPFRGTEIKILKQVKAEDLNLNFEELKNKAARAYEKLDEMENYVYHTGCRQQYILRYFGDHSAAPCGKCDSCLQGKGSLTASSKKAPVKEYLS